jgi:hypothetical protein
MTNTFRQHHKTIMWIIIVGTILSFVYYLTPTARNSGGGGGGSSTPVGAVDGEPVFQPQYEAALREAMIAVRMNEGHWPTAQEKQQGLSFVAFRQLFIAAKLKELNLEVPVDAATQLTRRLFGLQPGQPFPKDKFEEFVRNELNDRGKVSEDDFYHWVRDQVGLELLIKLYGLNGDLITSKEAEFFFRRYHESMSVEMVRFPLTNYTAQIVPTPQDVQDFYTKRQANYRLPEREQISCIPFVFTNYLPSADKIMAGLSNMDTQIDQAYLDKVSKDAAAFKDEAGKPLSAEAAKAKMKEDYRLMVLAPQIARTNAMQLTQLFFDSRRKALLPTNAPSTNQPATNQLITTAELEQFAASNGLTVFSPPAFDRLNPPKEMQLPPMYLDMIFHLDLGDPEDQYKLVPATNGFFLVVLRAKIPSEYQPLEVVRAKVAEDYRNSKGLEMAGKAGAAFQDAAEAGLAKGQSFDEICAEQKIKPQTLTPFSIDTKSIPEIEDQNEFEGLARIAFELPVGQMAPYQQLPNEGFLICVKARTPVDESVVQRDLPAFLAREREQRQYAAFSIWMGRELQLHTTQPAAKPAAGQASPSSG